MKINEYRRLARISLKARKKTTRSTIVGIVFGLIFIVPILFLGLGLSGDLQKNINKNPELLYASVDYAQEQYELNDTPSSYVDQKSYPQIIGSNHVAKFKEIAKEKVFYSQLYNTGLDFSQSEISSESSSIKYSVDNQQFAGITDSRNVKANLAMACVIDISENKIFAPAIIKNVYVADCDKGFYGDGKGQVVLSEALLKTIGKTPNEVYGKKFSIMYGDSQPLQKYGNYSSSMNLYPDNDSSIGNNFDVQTSWENSVERTLFNQFEVVGIMSEKLNRTYMPASLSPYGKSTNLLGSSMIFAKSSLYASNGTQFKPTFRTYEGDDKSDTYAVGTFNYTEDELANFSNGCVMPGIAAFSNYVGAKRATSSVVYQEDTVSFFGESYSKLNKICDAVADEISGSYTEKSKAEYVRTFTSPTFSSFQMIYSIFSYVSLAFTIFGGIILFSALVNLFNTIMHSVTSRKNYLGVMRAIGAQDKVIPNLYMFETFSIFSRAMIWIALIGGGVCIGLKILIDYLFNTFITAAMNITLTIGWEYIAYTFLIVIALLALFGWAFSYFCSLRISKQPITEVLSEE